MTTGQGVGEGGEQSLQLGRAGPPWGRCVVRRARVSRVRALHTFPELVEFPGAGAAGSMGTFSLGGGAGPLGASASCGGPPCLVDCLTRQLLSPCTPYSAQRVTGAQISLANLGQTPKIKIRKRS